MQDAHLDGAHVSHVDQPLAQPGHGVVVLLHVGQQHRRPAAFALGLGELVGLGHRVRERLLAEHRDVVTDGVDGIRAVRTGREQQDAVHVGRRDHLVDRGVAVGHGDAVLVAQFVAQRVREIAHGGDLEQVPAPGQQRQVHGLRHRAEPGHRDTRAVGHGNQVRRTARLAR
jgi:hypothetical protein